LLLVILLVVPLPRCRCHRCGDVGAGGVAGWGWVKYTKKRGGGHTCPLLLCLSSSPFSFVVVVVVVVVAVTMLLFMLLLLLLLVVLLVVLLLWLWLWLYAL
jgi:hypothetical protein